MKLAKIGACVAIGLVGLVALLVGLVFFVNRKDQLPNAAAQRLDRLLAARPAVAPGDNSFVYALGFNVPEPMSPVEVGARRMDWLVSFGTTGIPQEPDPASSAASFVDSASADALRLKEACSEDDRQACAREFLATAPQWRPNESEVLALRRYGELLSRRAWWELVPLDVSAPLPPYGDVIHAQRLYSMKLWQLAHAGKLDEVRLALEAEFEHWRAAHLAAQSLIPKMIAIAALRHHFFFTTLTLHELPPESFARVIPAGWEREFSAEELSMLRVMAGEYAFVRHLCALTKNGRYPTDDSLDEEHTAFARWIKSRMLGLLQVQAMANIYAERYLKFVDAFAVPIGDYRQAEQSMRAYLDAEEHHWSLYNPWSAFFFSGDDGSSYFGYPFRVASLEGMRSSALLTLQLRAAHIDPAQMPAALAASPLRDPMNGKAFEWNAETRSILFAAPQEHSWRRIEYFYVPPVVSSMSASESRPKRPVLPRPGETRPSRSN
jgi:hypothetical protein